MPKPSTEDFINSIPEIIQGISNPRNHDVIVEDFTIQGYDCTVVRTDMGHWLGYVIVPDNHPKRNTDKYDLDVEIHGGLTYSNTLHWKESKNQGKFAFGFDFMHAGDTGGSKEEAKSECVKLVVFLKENEG